MITSSIQGFLGWYSFFNLLGLASMASINVVIVAVEVETIINSG
jgi:hypothetical protein